MRRARPGAFKVRGGLVYAERLRTGRPEVRGIVSATRGNHVPVGIGSGISGVIGVRDLVGLRTEVVGVVAEQAPATARSVLAGRVVTTDAASTFIDGVACRVPDADAIAVISAGAARVLTISEDGAAEAMRVLYATSHNIAEPAGALALAGLLAERSRMAGQRVAVIQTGGNADADLLLRVLAGRTPAA
jgi:threonine dehydratase